MTDNEVLNKTIYTTFDEVSRMMDFCCEGMGEEKTTSRAFYDWYLKENTFFIPCGVFIMDGIFPEKSNQKLVCCFNFDNPDCTKFELCNYQTQETLCKYFFYREQNLDMGNITVDMQEFHYKAYQKLGQPMFSQSEQYNEIRERLASAKKALNTKFKGVGAKEKKRGLIKDVETIERRLYYISSMNVVRFLYATMYYSSKHQPELVEYQPKEIELKTGQVISEYKYTGYVNLNKPIYCPTIKKDPDEPTRDYQRHIQKWTVRGHYRRTSKGLIWIDTHTKGEGELEKRIYGTENESEVNVIPKVFEVVRNVSIESNHKPAKNFLKKEEPKFAKPPKVSLYKKVVEKIKNLIILFFK